MKKLVAVGIVLVLLGVWLSLQAPVDTGQSLPKLPTFQVDDVVTLQIKRGDTVVLDAVRQGQVWKQADADNSVTLQAAAVEQLLHDLQSMKPKRVVSRKAERFTRFAVDDHQVVLKDKNEKVLLDVFVGKPATDLTSTYIRLADSPVVLSVDKVLTWQVKRTHDAWLEKTKPAKEETSE